MAAFGLRARLQQVQSRSPKPKYYDVSRLALLALVILATLAIGHTAHSVGAEEPSPGTPLSPLTRTWAVSDAQRYPIGDRHLGGALRLRYVDHENANQLGLEDDPPRQFLRLRTQVSLDYRRSQVLRLFAMLNNESTKHLTCGSCGGGFDEIIFESLYLEATKPWGLPFGIRLGRQDLFYGDGFVVADGTPLDCSRTSYVNGALLTSRIPLWSFDAFWLRDPRREDFLPRINNKYTQLAEADQTAWGLFLRREPSPGTSLRYELEPYYVFLREHGAGRTSNTYTIGTRLALALGWGRLIGEFAYQGGKIPEPAYLEFDPEGILTGPQSVSAYGAHARLEAHLGPMLPVDMAAGYVYLSGDERETRNKSEGWNPVLGRWPLWSELYVHTLWAERYVRPQLQGFGYWQNLAMPFVRLAWERRSPLSFEAKYMWLDANQDVVGINVSSDDDPAAEGPRHRGQLCSFKLGWEFADLLAGHLLYENFRPGHFYPKIDGFKPMDASYLRLELSRSF